MYDIDRLKNALNKTNILIKGAVELRGIFDVKPDNTYSGGLTEMIKDLENQRNDLLAEIAEREGI